MTQHEAVIDCTKKIIYRLKETSSDSVARVSLAKIRRGAGHIPGEIPQIMGEFLIDMPDEIKGKDEASKGEWAVYTAITMYALHQQGRDRKTESVQKEGISLGCAANQLITDEDDIERVGHRFYPVATAENMQAISYYLRSLISLIRAKGIQLDYPMLAGDLFYYQFDEKRNGVRMKWGRDFWQRRVSDNENINNDEQNEKEYRGKEIEL